MRRSIFGLKSLVAIAAFGFAAHLQAAPITLASGSTVTAEAETRQDNIVTDPVTSLPFLNHNTTTTSGAASANVLSNLTTSALTFDFTLSIPDSGFASGEGDIFFTAGEGVTFAISGFQTAFGVEFVQEMGALLKDVTADNKLYDYDKFDFIGNTGETGSTFTLDSTGGSLTGSLIAGHLYEFDAFQLLDTEIEPTSNGSASITFAQTNPRSWTGPSVPLPPAFPAAILTVIALASGAKILRRKAVA